MKGVLTLTCYRCLRYATFQAQDRTQAHSEAKKKGWTIRDGKAVCKRCPK